MALTWLEIADVLCGFDRDPMQAGVTATCVVMVRKSEADGWEFSTGHGWIPEWDSEEQAKEWAAKVWGTSPAAQRATDAIEGAGK